MFQGSWLYGWNRFFGQIEGLRLKSVVVFDIDGLSIRTAGCYGNVEVSSPLLNEFAAQSRVYEQHYRAFVDSRRDRDAAIGSVVSMFDEVECRALLLSDVETESELDVIRFDGIDGLTGSLEEHFDSEDSVAWIRLAGDGSGEVDSRFPLNLVAKLIEADVMVVVTSCAPVVNANRVVIENEECIRVPLMVWCPDAARVQLVTTSSALDDVLLGEPTDPEEAAIVVRGPEAIAFRDPDAMLLVSRDCLASLERVDAVRLADSIDVTDEGLRLFRKPDDVWNVHNVLVEDVALAVEMLERLRSVM